MIERVVGVFRLDVNTFEEIEHDQTATSQAAIVVAIVALISGIGSGFLAAFSEGNFLISFFGTLIWAFIGWVLWSAITYFVGTTFFEGQADLGEMLRVIGFAQAPQVLSIIPCLGSFVGWIWSLIAGFIAVRQGLDLDNTRAFFTVLIGFLVNLVGFIIISVVIGGVSAFLGG